MGRVLKSKWRKWIIGNSGKVCRRRTDGGDRRRKDLGDIVSKDGRILKNIQMRVNKGKGILKIVPPKTLSRIKYISN